MSHSLAAPVVAALGTATLLSMLHAYLYRLERSRSLRLWAVAWCLYALRFAFALVGLWRPDAAVLVWFQQSLAVASGVMLVWGALVYTDRCTGLPWVWLAVGGTLILWVTFAVAFSLGTLILATPVFVFLGVANVVIGLVYLTSVALDRTTRIAVFIIFLLWGLHKFDYPFLRGVPDAAVWGYTLGAVFATAAGLGLLVLYLNQERRRASANRRKFETLVCSFRDVVFTLDRQCRYTGLYGRWIAESSLSEDAFLGKSAVDVYGPVGLRHVEMAQTAFRDRRPVTYEWSTPGQDGRQLYYQTTLSPIQVDSELPAELVGVGRDISDLKETQHELEERLREKSVLLKEVHHRVKNNLQVVVSLLYLREEAAPDEETRAAFRQLTSRIMAMALVHERLYQSENLASIAVKDYFEDLVKFVAGSNATTAGSDLEATLEADSVDLGVDQTVPLGLILVELLSNAAKHGASEEGPAVVSVSFRAREDALTLQVADNGPGMPEHFETRTGGTLGFALVESLVVQLAGKLQIESKDGARVTVTIPRQE